MSNWTLWIGVASFAVVGALLGLSIGAKMYTNEDHEQMMKEVRDLIKMRKHQVKGQPVPHLGHQHSFGEALKKFTHETSSSKQHIKH
jgi:hypothetical protein